MQTEYLTKFVRGHNGWMLTDVYEDRGCSGTSVKKRDGFERMLDAAHEGKIDIIVTKSVSRLSRNTVDLLKITRELREIGVEIYFEEHHLSSFDPKCELLLSIMASLAQEESRNLSENIKWGINYKMRKGEFVLPYKRFLGYRKGKDGLPEIIKKEARVVKRIYWLFLNGVPINRIAAILTKKRIPAPGGGSIWHGSTVKSILTNEKYKGEALLQKTYTPDYLTHKSAINNHALDQYYITNSHPAIISSKEWDEVQKIMKQRHAKK